MFLLSIIIPSGKGCFGKEACEPVFTGAFAGGAMSNAVTDEVI